MEWPTLLECSVIVLILIFAILIRTKFSKETGKIEVFKLGNSYTRNQIYTALGGNKQSYLPEKGGRIVCACLTPQRNPSAPQTILVGNGKVILSSAQKLIAQKSKVPVFLKNDVNDWRYDGFYEVESHTSDPMVIAHWARKSGRKDIMMIINMRRV